MSHKRTKSNSNPQRSSNQLKSILDVAVLTAGKTEFFSKCVDSILPEIEGLNSRIYICENGVSAEVRLKYDEIYKRLPSSTKLIRTNKNLGYPGGANKAIYAGMSPLCLFVSDDIILHKGAVDTLIRRMDDPKIALCGLKLVFPTDSTDPQIPAGKVQHVGHAMNIRGEITHPFIGWSPNNPKTCISRDVCSVTGAVFMVRRNAWNQAKGFFEGYGKGYFEDADLAFTLRKLGYRIYIDTNAIATHYVGTTMKEQKDLPPIDNNRMIFAMRHQGEFYWTESEIL